MVGEKYAEHRPDIQHPSWTSGTRVHYHGSEGIPAISFRSVQGRIGGSIAETRYHPSSNPATSQSVFRTRPRGRCDKVDKALSAER